MTATTGLPRALPHALPHDPSAPRPARAFLGSCAEMLLAMLLGMATLYPQWVLATSRPNDHAASWAMSPHVDALAMATAMAIPMALWMLHRGHGVRLTIELCLAMYAGFVVLFPLSSGAHDMSLMMPGHLLAPLFMLGAMVLRRREYGAGGPDYWRLLEQRIEDPLNPPGGSELSPDG